MLLKNEATNSIYEHATTGRLAQKQGYVKLNKRTAAICRTHDGDQSHSRVIA